MWSPREKRRNVVSSKDLSGVYHPPRTRTIPGRELKISGTRHRNPLLFCKKQVAVDQ